MPKLRHMKDDTKDKSSNIRSPFIKYCVTAVSCLLLCCVAFSFMLFKTNVMYSAEVDSFSTSRAFQQTTVQTVITQVEKEDSDNTADINNPIPGIEDEALDGEVIDMTGALEATNCEAFYYTFMAWQKVKSPTSDQYVLRQNAYPNWDINDPAGDPNAFDTEGFGKIDGRYVVATTWTNNGGIALVGDKLDVYLENGNVIKCIVGDIKSKGDSNWTKYGHVGTSKGSRSLSTIEFVVDKRTWYGSNHSNPGTKSCHPEWESPIVKIVREVKNE